MDVIFLLLTFFVYAMVLMVRAELLPVTLQPFVSGESASPVPAVTISIDRTGAIFYNRNPIELDHVVDELKRAKEENPRTAIYIAADEEGDVDRLPTFLALYDRLAFAGLDVNLVGRPSNGDASP